MLFTSSAVLRALDHAGPVSLPPEQIPKPDVRPHPHIDLSTISYLFGGQITHRDSLAVEQIIRPGEVNCALSILIAALTSNGP